MDELELSIMHDRRIAEQHARAAALGYPDAVITKSPFSTKKYRITLPVPGGEPKTIDYGRRGYSDFLMHRDEDRRFRFHSRFRHNVGYNDPNSPLFWSARLLW